MMVENHMPDIIKLFSALIFVIALMGGIALCVRKFGIFGIPLPERQGAKKRLKLVEILPLDARRRLMIVRRDDHTEHVILLGTQSEQIIETYSKDVTHEKGHGKR